MTTIRLLSKSLAPIVSVFFIQTAYAHSVQGGGLVNGLMHPVFGPDHLLAMVAVGILSVQIGGKAIWTVPATFLIFMLIGGILGIEEIPFPAVETGIAASVLVLGATIALARKVPALLAMIFVGLFGAFHGYAHGMEMPTVAEPALYASGFIISTAGLHIAGVLIGLISHRIPYGNIILRIIGAWIAAIGVYILWG